jgi:sugar lactone lactonase YvrE
MLKTISARLALCLLLAWSGLPLLAQEASDSAESAPAQRPPLEEMPQSFQLAYWLNQAALAFDDGDFEDWAAATERLHALRPYNQDFMTHLVRAYAHEDRFTEAYNMMLLMQQQGLAQDWSEFPELEDLRSHGLYEHLNTLMVKAREPFGEASVVTELEGIEMPEALAHDPRSDRYFIGTVRDGEILVSEDGENFTLFADRSTAPELMAVLDLAVDAERGHLWVATASVSQWRGYRQSDAGRTLLLKLDLDSGEVLSTHRLVPDRQPHAFGALAVAADGSVYAADMATPGVYRLRPDEQMLEPFFRHPNFTSTRGIALSADGSLLYLADYEIGIFVVRTSNASQAWKLFVPENLNEGGIDGLYWWEGHLVAIQNGIDPDRVLRMKLGDDGLGVVEVAPLVSALPQFDTPTYGEIVGDDLVFLAGSHWHHVDPRGRRTGTRLPAIALMKTDLESARVLSVGQEMVEELMRRQEEGQNDGADGQ